MKKPTLKEQERAERQHYEYLAEKNCANLEQIEANTQRAALYLAAMHKEMKTPAIVRFFHYWFNHA